MSIEELDIVRIVKLLQDDRQCDGTAGVQRAPRIGDTGTVVHVHAVDGAAKAYTVEDVDASGYTIWLADFHLDELVLQQKLPRDR